MTVRVAVVTGAGSGIGRATTRKLLANDFRVVLVGRRVDTLEATLAEASSAENALITPADVTDPLAIEGAFEIACKRFGRIDVLFNNAGASFPAVHLDELTVQQWKTIIDVNLNGAFICTRAAFRIMKTQAPRGGRIINNGSIAAHTPRPFSAPYTASKHALTGLTKSTSLDGRAYDIACSQIDIGNANTERGARFAKGVIQASGQIAVEPLLDVEHVANAVLFIAALPLDANVQVMTILPSKMPFVGRG